MRKSMMIECPSDNKLFCRVAMATELLKTLCTIVYTFVYALGDTKFKRALSIAFHPDLTWWIVLKINPLFFLIDFHFYTIIPTLKICTLMMRSWLLIYLKK